MSSYKDSFVAFIDILGFKNFILKENFEIVDAFFRNINGVCSTLKNYKNEFFTKEMMDTITINIISDSIIISVPKSTKFSLEILLIIVNTIAFKILFSHNLLCRGAISEGDFYSNDNIAYGPAFVNAYNLQEHVAIYPRIIFTRDIYDSYLKMNGKESVATLSDLMTLDKDCELFFADYIKFSLLRMNNDSMHILSYNKEAEKICYKIKNFIEDEIACQTNPNIREKYIYFEKYYNNTILYLTEMCGGIIYKCEPIFNDKYRETEFYFKNHSFNNNNINNSNNVAFGNGANITK